MEIVEGNYICVIMVVQDDNPRPTEIMTEKAWGRNDDGAGIAWRETVRGKKVVKWKKGLDKDEMNKLCQSVPKPFVAHWRIASCGGVLDELTHPFPIDANTSLDLEGTTSGYVMFHNGTWNDWEKDARAAAFAKNRKVPSGKWSDTRAIAWIMALYGHGFMELLTGQRGVAFGPEDMDIFIGPGWSQVNGIWCSNDYFMSYRETAHMTCNRGNVTDIRPMCRYAGCAQQNLDSDHRCTKHPKASFPTDGYEKQKVSGVTQASPIPFCTDKNPEGKIVSVRMMEMMTRARRPDGSRRLSLNLFKKLRKAHLRMAMGGPKAEKARKLLVQTYPAILSLVGRSPSTPPQNTPTLH